MQMYNSPYKGAISCARTIYRAEGIKAFYRSYTTQLSMNIPFQVTHFIGYEYLQDSFNYNRKYDPVSHMLSGAGAGAFASAVTNPLDVAKTLLNTRSQHKELASEQRISGMLTAMTTIYKTHGVRGYYKGITARILYQMPSTAICWSVYEFFKHFLGIRSPDCEQPPS
jgi:solute carrier family 25 iron transporter 28/37